MKILIISDAWLPQLNGVVRTYEYLMQTLKSMGHDVQVIGPSSFKNRFPMPGYSEIELVPLPSRRLIARIKEFQPDAIHIATEGPLGWAARKYCRKEGIKFTTSYHTQFPDYAARRLCYFFPFFYKFVHQIGVNIMKHFHSTSTALLITTGSMAEELRGWGFSAPIQPFTRGIDTDLFYPGESDALSKYKEPIALYVGRLAIEKSVEEFLEMPWDGTKIIVGHGPDEDMLRKKYPDGVFMGKKVGKELADIYRAADIFVFPSRTDTFGIVVIEALACGLPVVAHDVIGPRDILVDERLGVLDEDLETAAQKALGLKDDKEYRHQFVIQHYSWDKAAEQFLKATSKTIHKPEKLAA